MESRVVHTASRCDEPPIARLYPMATPNVMGTFLVCAVVFWRGICMSFIELMCCWAITFVLLLLLPLTS